MRTTATVPGGAVPSRPVDADALPPLAEPDGGAGPCGWSAERSGPVCGEPAEVSVWLWDGRTPLCQPHLVAFLARRPR